VTSTLLTQIDDALTAAAIVIGGAFAYLKFIKGRVLTAAVGCTHDGADLLRDALGQFICDICGQPCEDEPPDGGGEP
jgi:hypothetical protein